ncbi:MAG TPA: TonB-dependent receptor [Bacteroidales bacterium]|nr:TonB-dependent receptor [Bacteroidales bacterium]HSA44709.1 TonB-dependent receptor [Bacteroidales bacterium]
MIRIPGGLFTTRPAAGFGLVMHRLLRFCWFAALVMAVPDAVKAQAVLPDSAIALKGIEVSGNKRFFLMPGMQADTIDSLVMRSSVAASLAGLLGQHSLAYIRDYGQGNLSSISLRGTASSHTSLNWMGFELNAPGSGMSDMSILPLFLFGNVRLVNGFVMVPGMLPAGGTVYLDPPSMSSGRIAASAGFSLGSFSDFRQYVSVYGRKEGSACRVAYLHQHADNDFPYTYRGVAYRRGNAVSTGRALMVNTEHRSGRHTFYTAAWLQDAGREVPPSVSAADLNANRRDEAMRAVLRWKRPGVRNALSAGVAAFHEYLHYTEKAGDTLLLLDSRIRNRSVQADFGLDRKLGFAGLLLHARVSGSAVTVNTGDFGGSHRRKSGGWGLTLFKPLGRKDWKAGLTLRQDWVKGMFVPPAPSAGIEGSIAAWQLKAQVTRNFRIPSMNDVYWVPGGNPGLKPERGWNYQAGIHWFPLKHEESGLALGVDAYYTLVDQWISWIPDGKGVWTAENVQKVEICGCEPRLEGRWRSGSFGLKMNLSASLSSSTYLTKTGPYDNSRGKQLIYTPRKQLKGALQATFGSFVFAYTHNFTGKIFTVRDNSSFLDAWNTGSALFRQTLPISRTGSAELQFEIKNCWDESYEAVAFYPMPGRAFLFTLIYKYQ